MEESHTARNIFGITLVALIGVVGIFLMLTESNVTGEATSLRISSSVLVGCNEGEFLLSARGVEALKYSGREKYGPDFSPYRDAHISYNGVGYCADASIVRALLG